MESTRSNNRGFSSEGALVPSVVWRLLVSGVMALAFLVVDQVSKMIVRRAVMTGFFSVEVIPGVLGLEFVANRGAAFGLGEGMGWVFVLLAVGVTAFVLVYLLRAPRSHGSRCWVWAWLWAEPSATQSTAWSLAS